MPVVAMPNARSRVQFPFEAWVVGQDERGAFCESVVVHGEGRVDGTWVTSIGRRFKSDVFLDRDDAHAEAARRSKS